jgi:hypothetical protein
MKNSKQKTSIYHNPYNVINAVIEFVDKANNRIDACVDYTRPSLVVDIAALKKAPDKLIAHTRHHLKE